jgi:serpin B
VHRAALDLDEEGVKAVAVTGGALASEAAPVQEPTVPTIYANHPFLFLIQHVPTGLCLFMGRVTDPAPDAAATPASPPFRLPTPER